MSPVPFLPLMIGPLGMQEMLIILVVALIVFGPRKLPQIGKTLGKSIAEFRRTSTELRSTLEREVQMEEFRAARTEISGLEKDVSNLGRGSDSDTGSASRGEGRTASGNGDETGAGDQGDAATGDPKPAPAGSRPPAATSGGEAKPADTSKRTTGAGDPNPESRQDTGK